MPEIEQVPEEVRAKAQEFFEGMAAEMAKPHFGEHARAHHRAVLIRAEEFGLYQPQR